MQKTFKRKSTAQSRKERGNTRLAKADAGQQKRLKQDRGDKRMGAYFQNRNFLENLLLMISTKKFARLSAKRQVFWLLHGLKELRQTRQFDQFYDSYLKDFIERRLRLGRAIEAQWQRCAASAAGTAALASTAGAAQINRASEWRELAQLLRQVAGTEPSDWEPRDGEPEEPSENSSNLFLYLDRVRSPFNVGALFRSAAAFGVCRIILHPHCPDLEHPRTLRTAMGCTRLVPALRSENPLQDFAGLPWLALETPDVIEQYIPCKKMRKTIDTVRFPASGGLLLVGAEVEGLRAELLEYCAGSQNRELGGTLFSIPMPGPKQSLNLAVAASIALQRWSETIQKAQEKNAEPG